MLALHQIKSIYRTHVYTASQVLMHIISPGNKWEKLYISRGGNACSHWRRCKWQKSPTGPQQGTVECWMNARGAKGNTTGCWAQNVQNLTSSRWSENHCQRHLLVVVLSSIHGDQFSCGHYRDAVSCHFSLNKWQFRTNRLQKHQDHVWAVCWPPNRLVLPIALMFYTWKYQFLPLSPT